jgi:serine/threonine protein kinase
MIDFGLSKQYRNPKTGQHIPFREGKHLTGTARYASLNTHQGGEQSRRDDLESLGYIFVYFMKGELPWQSVVAETKEDKYEQIKVMKEEVDFEEFCEGMPNEFVRYFEYVRKLGFDDKPSYKDLRKMFCDLMIKKGFMNADASGPDYREIDWLEDSGLSSIGESSD